MRQATKASMSTTKSSLEKRTWIVKPKISSSAAPEGAVLRAFATETRTILTGQADQLRAMRKRERTAARRNHTGEKATDSNLLIIAGQMMYGIAHDVRHYMCCLVANVEMMCDDSTPPSARKQIIEEFYEVIGETCAMLDLPLAAVGGRQSSMRLEELDGLVERALRRVRCHPIGKGVAISFERPVLPRQRVNAVMLTSAVFNLVLNACQAVGGDDRNGSVDVTLTCSGGYINIRVADDGPGLPDSVRASFLGSSRIPRGTGRGFGMGLSVAAQAALAHGGTLSIEESRSGRTVMALRIPHEVAIA
jgi:signal transduction histidine kinase